MSKYQYSTNTIYYQKARFFRKNGTNEFAYCIEPFRFFQDGSTYNSVITPNNLSESQKKRIERIAHFGYGYKNHTDVKWYAITQMMIWETADPTSGSFFFTDSLNGNKIYPYENEKTEINNLVNNYDTLPNTTNQNYITREGGYLKIDGGNILNYYSVSGNNIKKEGQYLIIEDLDEGEYEFTLTRNDNTFNKPIIFYQSSNSQNLMQTGDLEERTSKFSVTSYKTSITINKLDKDTYELSPRGEAKLDGSKFKIYNNNNEEINEFVIENGNAIIENLDFGTYYIKEIEPGIGYTLDETTYKIEISEKNPKPFIDVYNKVIEKNIKIIKKYGERNNFQNEQNIDFEIYDSDNVLVTTITTNEKGEAQITLPYGHYKIVQINSSEGYSMVDPFNIEITDTKEETINLKDYKIPVPNTHTDFKLDLLLILHIILMIL